MGYYVNPEDESKERFLVRVGQPISQGQALIFDFTSDYLPVCLVDNGLFTAAGIAYNREEVVAFTRPDDHRPKLWFKVLKADLKPWYDKEPQ